MNCCMRAGPHADSKNVEGSYSALFVVQTGQPFCGGYYMLPQYHAALDVRRGDELRQSSVFWGVGSEGFVAVTVCCLVTTGLSACDQDNELRQGIGFLSFAVDAMCCRPTSLRSTCGLVMTPSRLRGLFFYPCMWTAAPHTKRTC